MSANGAWGARSGQMVVELAVLVPVVLVVALVGVNLMEFKALCARFDRACLDAVVSHGVSPAGEQSQVGAVDEVREALSLAMGGSPCVVRVSAERLDDGAGGASFEISPFLTRYTCSMTFAPWPRELRLPGVSLEAPAVLSHSRELVVDRFRPGVVI